MYYKSNLSYSKSNSFDWVTLSVYFSLVIIGWFMVFSTLYDDNNPYAFLDFTTPIGSQTLWVIISILIFLATLAIDWKFWNVLAFPIYGVTLLFLILVLIFGKEVNGAKAWFSFGFFSFQPAEWAKFGTALAVSSYLNFVKNPGAKDNTMMTSIALFVTPALLVLLQPDFGSSIVFLSFFILLYRRGMSPAIILLGISLAAVFIFSLLFSPFYVTIFLVVIGTLFMIFDSENIKRAFLYSSVILGVVVFMIIQGEKNSILIPTLIGFFTFLFFQLKEKKFKLPGILIPVVLVASTFAYGSNYVFDKVLAPHQQDRINVWLRPEKCDPQGSLYNLIQSKLAIGSGGFTGKGFLQGEMTKLNYVPEQSTDFIFTSIGEEQGFVGSVGVIILFSILLFRCVTIAERANLEFIRNFGYAVTGILLTHYVVNIGMTMGLLPVVGIPLPFISKGGSSLVAFTLMVGVLLKMDTARFRSN